MTPMPSLQSLIETVRADAPSDEPLEQLAQASRSATAMESLGDALLGHFVESCRASGYSWTEISAALGVSKQAAHKRFTVPAAAPTFERFTDRARMVLRGSIDEARAAGRSAAGTEHLLLALLEPAEALAAQVLHEAGLGRDAIVARIAELGGLAGDQGPVTGEIGLSPRARKALRQAVDESLRLGHNYIGTEHLLLGLFADADSLADRVLGILGVTRDDVDRRLREKFEQIQQSRRGS